VPERKRIPAFCLPKELRFQVQGPDPNRSRGKKTCFHSIPAGWGTDSGGGSPTLHLKRGTAPRCAKSSGLENRFFPASGGFYFAHAPLSLQTKFQNPTHLSNRVGGRKGGGRWIFSFTATIFPPGREKNFPKSKAARKKRSQR